MPSDVRSTIVLIHGFPGGSGDFAPVARELVARGCPPDDILTPDLIGFGAEAGHHSFDEMWIPAQVDRLERLLADRRQVVLVGHDVGGPIALVLAERLGPRVAGLVLTSCNLLRDPPLAAPFRLMSRPVIGRPIESALFSRASLRAMARFGRRQGPTPRRNTREESEAIRTIFASALRDPERSFGAVQDALESYPGPMTHAIGDRDPFFTVAQARSQADRAQRGQLTVLVGVGHFPQLESPKDLADLIVSSAPQEASAPRRSPGL